METNQPAAPAASETKPAATTPEAAPRKYAEKYESPEALEKAYLDLQSRFTKAQQGKGDAQPSEQPKTPEPLLWNAVQAELKVNKGKLSDKSIELLGQKFGIPANLAREFEAFTQTKNEATTKSLQTRLDKDVGEGITVQDVLDNAHKYLTPGQLKNVQNGMDEGLEGAFIDAARIVAKNKKAPAAVGSVDASTKGGYASAKDIQAATNDNRFGVDRTYTRSVEALINSTPSSIVEEWSAFGRKRK